MIQRIILTFLIAIIKTSKSGLIQSVLNQLHFKSPFNIQSEKAHQVSLTKELPSNDIYINVQRSNTICDTEVEAQMVITDCQSLTLVVLKNATSILEEMECKVNEQVYFLNVDTKEVFETYIINNNKIVQKVGEINNELDMKWFQSANFIERRMDFYGIHFKALVEQDGIWAKIDDKFSTEAPFFPNNQTWDISDYVSGVVMDVLEEMKSKYNFTLRYYLRKDRKWGNVIHLANGTVQESGMVGDIYYDRADIIACTPSFRLVRLSILDYIIPSLKKGKANSKEILSI